MKKDDFTLQEILIILLIQTLINSNPSLKEKFLVKGGNKNND